jgi:tetratricopeptide (TPR) repeat protein
MGDSPPPADDLSNPQTLVESLVAHSAASALALVLETAYTEIQFPTLLQACAFLARTQFFLSIQPDYLSRLESDFPVECAAIRASLLLQNATSAQIADRCRQAIALIKGARPTRDADPIVSYNLAFLNARLKLKQKAMKHVKRSILAATDRAPPVSAVLLLTRILRSNCQSDEAVALALASRDLLDCYDRDILIEGMLAAAESGDFANAEALFQLLRANFKDDPVALNASVSLNLILGKTDGASECFETWADLDEQTAEFYFAYGQLALAAKDYAAANVGLFAACELQPTCGKYYAAAATLLARAGATEKAQETARHAIRVDPDCPHAWLALATVAGDTAEGSSALAKAVELRRNSVDLSRLRLLLADASS